MIYAVKLQCFLMFATSPGLTLKLVSRNKKVRFSLDISEILVLIRTMLSTRGFSIVLSMSKKIALGMGPLGTVEVTKGSVKVMSVTTVSEMNVTRRSLSARVLSQYFCCF